MCSSDLLLDVPRDRAGRVQVAPDLTVPGHPEIYAIGDMVAVQSEGRTVPGVAPAAKQMGEHAATNLLADLRNQPRTAFVYRDYGNLATIGRMAGVAHLGRIKLSGAPAWWFWLVAHVFFLIGFRNRVVVLLNWTLAYWTHRRAARIIFGPAPEVGPEAPVQDRSLQASDSMAAHPSTPDTVPD